MTEDDGYWDDYCSSCKSEGRFITNLACVKEIALTTGTPLEQAMKVFRKPEQQRPPFTPAPSEATTWSHYVQQYKYENGEPE